ncbi:helix-turn-helix domain-containing protein [Bradyrhizobium sp. DOA1]|uniref:helix-turn-helix domain-containing protein n=1 Tax=Bradyrhizobium sp. DOA1 TaxID=1126616 RepID=UPI00077CD65E|nr:helix-turn-helix domain-containing protein [Bradyrhizobium sp. DOA1]KYG99794.1 hypothetical protein SE91_15995 [Bradyrhizobium sp. DOA1]
MADGYMSERTLQRRITVEGHSFRDLPVAARRELCEQLAAKSEIGIDDIAFLLGYQDTTSFHRAFPNGEA